MDQIRSSKNAIYKDKSRKQCDFEDQDHFD